MVNSPQLRSQVRAHRVRAGLSQLDLARRVGVSRQTLGAIEAGRQQPSTLVALQLARALGCAVEALFALGPGAGQEVIWIGAAAEPGSRVWLGRVDGRLVAHRVDRESAPADGVVGPSGELERLSQGAEAEVLVAGCAPLLGLLAGRMERVEARAQARWIRANSARALELLVAGAVHIAGIHLAPGSSPAGHAALVRAALPDASLTLIHLLRWRQGLVLAAGNPLGLRGAADLARPGLRCALREPGAGARKLWEDTVAGVAAPLQTAPVTPTDHADVARLVGWGVADVGVAIESAARAGGLGFVPLAEERFDLVVPTARLSSLSVRRFLAQLEERGFRQEAARLPGYDLRACGDVTTVAAS